MPFVHIRLADAPRSIEQTRQMQAEVTALMATCLGKRAGLTAVLIEGAPEGAWSVGGAPVDPAAHLEATITAGTNSVEEKARFVEQAHALLATGAAGELPLATYVVVREVEAESWGYGGRTQAARRAGA
ncbi:tautomerase family protein [Aureimonas ureilytica]|uniref:tautomerase family protein n=1 Tax=Aureimonas ureilytica TaxID=401562 RepID=UPI0003A9830E|nr:tautomerase family protein [Aureimonas ureilytica]